MTVAAAILCLPASWLATVVPYNPRAYALHGTVSFHTSKKLCSVGTLVIIVSYWNFNPQVDYQRNDEYAMELNRLYVALSN